jgi:hypothetical protein
MKGTGYATTLANYRNWWHAFWQRSFVQYANGADDYLENVYYLATYMIAAGGFGNYPLHFINGVFRATQDNSKWSNGYWYWNQRDVYNSFYASNHVDLMAGFNRLYSRNLAAMKAYTQTRHGIDGFERTRDLLGRQERDHRPGGGAAAVPDDDPGKPATRPRRRAAGRLADRRRQPRAVPDGERFLLAARPTDVADAQRRERGAGTGVALRPHRHRLHRLPDGREHVQRPAAPVRERVGERPRARRPVGPRRPGVQRHAHDAAEVPEHANFVGKFTLLAKDGFLVSSEREAGEVKYVGIRSLHGKQARVVNPWGTQQVRVRRTSDNAILTTSTANEVTFATASNTTYVVERTAKPLTSYSGTTLTGSPNQGQKSLPGTASTLGLNNGATGVTALRALANNLYVQAGNAGAAPLIANGPAVGPWEQFDLIELGNGNVALRARVNGMYVCAENAGANPLIANRTSVGSWETFARVDNPDGTVSLRATVNNLYVVAENGGAAPLVANRTAIGPWEKFTLLPS